ncbi:MAG: TetR/AcrR family transcriptional regulator [Gammaproteobacteria bacterium]|jgi:AcrR family transcriptional regulator|nr:TetR/AcrR family transcriptional regulator [Gammaproteobacteria bacterium]
MTERTEYATPVRRPRRKRDPEGTREAILQAAGEVLAQDGKEGVSVAQVAQRAGVNRGTAYQHFQTREQLIEATTSWVSERLYRAVFGDPAVAQDQPVESISIEALTEHIAQFAMDNPDIGRVWLFELLSSKRPANDPFWQQYLSNFDRFSKTELAQPGVDAEVASVLTLAGAFLWPVWARAHSRSTKERQQMAKRFTREMLRFSLHGSLRPEKYPELDARVRRKEPGRRHPT